MKHVMGFGLGVAACVLVILIMIGCFSIFSIGKDMESIEKETLRLCKDTSIKNNAPTINELKMRMLNLDEKITSTNKRFDDLYILGGIIITLIIAINIGIFISVDGKVDEYFKEHFDEHRQNIVKCEKDAGELIAKIKIKASALDTPEQSDTQS